MKTKKYDIEKNKERLKETSASTFDGILIVICMLGFGLCEDFGLSEGYTARVITAFIMYEIGWIVAWLISVIIHTIRTKRQLKRDRESEVIVNEDK